MAKQRSTPHATVNQLDNIEDDEEVFTLNSSDSKRLYSHLDVGGKRIRCNIYAQRIVCAAHARSVGDS